MSAVVVTGLGLVLPGAATVDAAKALLEAGTPQFRELSEALGLGRGAVAELPAGVIPPMQARRLDRPSRFAWAAAQACFQDADLDPGAFGGERIAVAVGTLSGGNEASEAFMRPYLAKGPEGASPLLFPNCVANAASGHVAVAFGLKGPSTTQLERETGAFAALDQAARWLRLGACDAALVIGADGLHPLLLEVAERSRLLARHGNPIPHGATGFLPGEGAQAFLLERESEARARGARVRARLGTLASRASEDRLVGLRFAVAEVLDDRPGRWIAGANGHRALDRVEAGLGAAFGLPSPAHPKALWGELCGAGGQLLAAALLAPSDRTLVTAPSTFGPQFALRLEDVRI
jgi:3-oxoacyl-[acyl-carrier-protein] synthase II